MDTGTDGRVYDPHYDFNENGKLDMDEYVIYQDTVYGKNDMSFGTSRKSYVETGAGLWTLIKAILMIGLIIVGFGLMILCPPVGAIFMVAGYRIKDSF